MFAPPSPSYLPYSNGRWVYTDYGYTWVSADPFGWATDHYGRWVWANRWVWRPDTTWGPAWVQWRQGDGYVGWAPAGYTDDAYVPDESWRFVGAASLFAPDVPRYYVTANIGGYLRGAVPGPPLRAPRQPDLGRRSRRRLAAPLPRREAARARSTSSRSAATTISSAARRNGARTSTSATGTRAAGKTTGSGAICTARQQREDEARRRAGARSNAA